MKRDLVVAGMVLSLICLAIVLRNISMEGFFVSFLGVIGWVWFYIDVRKSTNGRE